MPSMVWARSNWKKCVFSIACSFWICSVSRKLVKVHAEFRDARPIRLARIFLALIAVFWNRFNERPFGVAIFVGSVRASELPIDINHDSGFLRTRSSGVAGKDSLRGRRDNAGFPGIEETQRDFYVSILSLQAERFARQRVEQRAAQRTGGNGQNSRRLIPISQDVSNICRSWRRPPNKWPPER